MRVTCVARKTGWCSLEGIRQSLTNLGKNCAGPTCGPFAGERHSPAQGVRGSDASRIIVRSEKSGRQLARWANFLPGFPSSSFSANSAIQFAFRYSAHARPFGGDCARVAADS